MLYFKQKMAAQVPASEPDDWYETDIVYLI